MVRTKNAVTAPSPLSPGSSTPPAEAAGAASSETENEPVSRSRGWGEAVTILDVSCKRGCDTETRAAGMGSASATKSSVGRGSQPGRRTTQKGLWCRALPSVVATSMQGFGWLKPRPPGSEWGDLESK